MTEDRIHRVTTQDGVEIAGRVHGDGPPLIFVHGALADGETGWQTLLPYLTSDYTCYAPSVRARGLSGPSDDFTRQRLVEDVTTFADSIGEPAGIVGLSGGALLSLAAAQSTSSVAAVAAYEPPVFEVMSEDVAAAFNGTIERMAEMASEGRMADAARTFVEFVTNEEELRTTAEMKFFDALAPNVPVQLEEFKNALNQGASPTDPSALATIDVPVLLLHGTRSKPHPWFINGVRHVAEHVPRSEVRQITGAGHLGPILEPAAVAEELHRFFRA